MANNNYVQVAQIAAETLVGLESNLVAGNVMYTDKTADFAKVGGYSVGESVSIKTRPNYSVDEFTAGGTVNLQDTRESETTLSLEKHFDISVAFGAREMAMDIDNLNDQVILPAAKALADKIDTYLLSKAWEARGMYTSANLLTSAGDIAQASKTAKEQQISNSGRVGFVNSTLEASLLSTDVFHRLDSRGDRGVDALTEASMGRLMGIDFVSSINFTDENHVTGNGTGATAAPTATVNVQGVSTLTLNADLAGTIQSGDRIQVAGLKRPLIAGAQVVGGVGVVEIPLTHQIDELIVAGSAVTVIGASGTSVDRQGLILEPNSFSYIMPPLPELIGGNSSVLSVDGKSIRVSLQSDINSKATVLSLDCLIGASVYDARKSLILGSLNA